jgi:2-succinyl-5-enolpyruvyl-6-hydroxy-3-cyclohexene-1-carboxylate synthase
MSEPPRDPNRSMLWGRAIAEELARSGVEAVCIAPGSRSAPLAIAMADQPALRCIVHLDERSAGFYALGIARASRRPVALLCTSGTAAANFLPAVVEAYQARVPLVVLTADRPPELRGVGAPQTIDQVRLFGAHVLAYAELPAPEPRAELLRALRAAVGRLIWQSCGPPCGPVHLNVPLRDPLDLREVPGDVPAELGEADPVAVFGRGDEPFLQPLRGIDRPCRAEAIHVAEAIRSAACGLIVVGPQQLDPVSAKMIAALARASGYPILADAASQLRWGTPSGTLVLGAYDAFLRSQRFREAHPPELILRFGDPPTSKVLTQYLQANRDVRQILVDPDGRLADPTLSGVEALRVEVPWLCGGAASLLDTPVADGKFVAGFVRAEARARHALDAAAKGEWFEAGLVAELSAALPERALLFAGNSMPIRELDAFLPVRQDAALDVLANRGANGIDGLVSTALGAMAA